ncbi:Putative ribosomal pseudouridine synthase [hydrothermal vent metagenome]|uniref:Ribosomal pseudouridine synthase n=1 Tax=hydrothermal vent metagenome TaxID=652676 RepID=A0A3B1E9B2_9ZZZZ
MPFILKQYPVIKGKKVQLFLSQDVGLTMSLSQRLLARGRVFDENGNRLQNGQVLKDSLVSIAIFEGQTKGLKPIFNTTNFAIFDKPSGIMVHPTSKETKYTLLDEIRYQFGDTANLAHRIDMETSGLVLVTKNKYSDIILKTMFEDKKCHKKYQAIVAGHIKKELIIDDPIIKDGGKIGVKMKVDKNGKASKTIIKPLKYFRAKNQTLIEAIPLTGRQHQIRVHLNNIGHTIIGDPIYGVDELIADKYLNKQLSNENRLKCIGHERLMLHAFFLKFNFNNILYTIYSKLNF